MHRGGRAAAKRVPALTQKDGVFRAKISAGLKSENRRDWERE